MSSRKALLLAAALAIACDDSPSRNTGGGGGHHDATVPHDASNLDANSTDATTSDAGGMDAMLADSGSNLVVPDPGTMVGADWTDVEPNDTPDHATPVGVLGGALWMGFASPVTTINSNTDSDYFVFKTGTDAASLMVNMQVCWSGNIDLLNLYLYAVTDGHPGAMIRAAETTNTQCETILSAAEAATTLMINTTYLLEVRAAPGLNLGANSGVYSA